MTGWGEVDEDSCRLRLAWSDKGLNLNGLGAELVGNQFTQTTRCESRHSPWRVDLREGMLRIQTKVSTPRASAPLNEAIFTDRSQPRAKRFGGLAAACLDADPSPYGDCTHLEGGPDDDGLIIPKYGLMFLLKHTVGGKRLDLGAIAGELNGPREGCFVRQVFRRRRGLHGDLAARHFRGNCNVKVYKCSLWLRPLLRGPARHDADIGLRLRRQRPLSGKPVANASRAGIVGSSCQSEIAELGAQLAQEFGRLGQRLRRIERIAQKALRGRHGHELRDALGLPATACNRADRVGSEPAFLPDDAGEELEGQPVCRRCRFNHLADGGWIGCWRDTLATPPLLASARGRRRACRRITRFDRPIRVGLLRIRYIRKCEQT